MKDDTWTDPRGRYKIVMNTPSGPVNYTLDFKSNTSASLIGKDTITSRFYFDGRQVRINVAPERRGGENLRLSGIVNNEGWSGYGEDSLGRSFTWTASYDQPGAQRADSARKRPTAPLGKLIFPFVPFGWTEDQAPQAGNDPDQKCHRVDQ